MKTPLTPEEAARVFDLVAEVDALDREQQQDYLAQACAGAPGVRAEVESLLGFQSKSPKFLAQPVVSNGLELLALGAEADLAPGTVLGDCRVISLLGVGGMGEVYLAEDTVNGRRVALKLIGQSRSEEVRGRHFRHERKMLAALNHPHIARLYGSGITEKGQAYLVMEYVEGERLDRFCDRQGLDVPARLALFRKVCAAVAYAHQNLVVHRDLKPANIRVTREGEPKLLDFGIAKLLDPEGASVHVDPTVTLSGAMTPEYASPEQLRGETITTVSDVYSLGVVLYELLCGQRPYAALKSRRPDELVRAICEQEPPRPSTVASRNSLTTITMTVPAGQVPVTRERPATLRRLLEGDLDNITAKALRTEPARRYPSALALSEDLRRHCEGLPVTARKDTLGYRAGKFVRRNKAGVIAGALLTLTLVAGLVATTLEARRADRRFEDVRQLAHSILFEVEPQMANVPGTIPARSTLVKRALEYLDSLSREAGSRRDLRRELAAAYEKVGTVQGEPNQPNLGDLPGALASFRKALDLRRALVAADAHEPRARHELADCEEHVGEILWWSNQTEAAEQTLRDALALRRRLVDEQPRSVEFRLGLASVLVRLGGIPAWNFQSAEAMTLYREALPILQVLAREHPQDTEVQISLARCLGDLAVVQRDTGDYPGATQNLSSAEAIVSTLATREPNNFTARNLLRYTLYSEIFSLLAQGANDQALALCPRMLSVAESLAKSDPDNTASQHNLSSSDEVYGQVLMLSHRWREALEKFQAALAIEAKFVAASSANVDYQRQCGANHTEIGRAYVQLGEFALAETAARTGQDLLESAFRLDPDSVRALQDLVRAYELRGDLCEQGADAVQARQWFQRALDTMRSHVDTKISAGDLSDWTALREKLTGKTAQAVTLPPPP